MVVLSMLKIRPWEVRAADYTDLPFCTAGIPRIPPCAGKTLRGAITTQDFEFFVGRLPNNRAPGPNLPFELLRHAPGSMKEVVRTCINLVLTREAPPPRSWLGGLIGFLLKKRCPGHSRLPSYLPAGHSVQVPVCYNNGQTLSTL